MPATTTMYGPWSMRFFDRFVHWMSPQTIHTEPERRTTDGETHWSSHLRLFTMKARHGWPDPVSLQRRLRGISWDCPLCHTTTLELRAVIWLPVYRYWFRCSDCWTKFETSRALTAQLHVEFGLSLMRPSWTHRLYAQLQSRLPSGAKDRSPFAGKDAEKKLF